MAVTVVRCEGCGLVFPDPMPLPERLGDLYDVDPAAYWPPEYFQEGEGYLEGEARIAAELLGRREGVRALDVGAGIGLGVQALRRHGFDAVGLEPSHTFRALGSERLGLDADALMAGTVEEADLPPESFDYLHYGAVLEHLPRPREALARGLNWLKSGGILFAEVPHARWLMARGLNAWYRWTGQGMVTHTSPMHPPYHLFEFTRRSFERATDGLPARVVRVEFWVAAVPGPRAFRSALHGLMERTGTGMQLAVWLRKA